MDITLNSPKYADTKSLQYQMWKKQQDRKKRKSFTPELFERYFRRNLGTLDYATIPEVTLTADGDIEFQVLTSDNSVAGAIIGNSNNALDGIFINSSGGISVRDSNGVTVSTVSNVIISNTLHTVVVTPSAGFVEISVDGSSRGSGSRSGSYTFNEIYGRQGGSLLLQGILANLKIYDTGTLIRNYPIDDNGDTLVDRVSGQNGTVINGTPEQWQLYTQQSTGEWLGQELVINGDFSQDAAGWTINSGYTISNGLASVDGSQASDVNIGQAVYIIGRNYRSQYSISEISSSNFQFISNAWTSPSESIAGVYSGDNIYTSGAGFFNIRATSSTVGSIDNVSVKEVLNVA